tara:strand:+ start:1303 stop:1746 length:444 start_codon:yes stop_codon:yes gene_type:complete
MGMDVYGKAAHSEEGKYFRNNVWSWRPLATYCQDVAPVIAAHCVAWQTNDGLGLNNEHSLALAAVLQEELRSGRTEAYEKAFDAKLKALPLQRCLGCSGTGLRQGKDCGSCKGTGKVEHTDCWYSFTVENVEGWVTFLEHCGGFEIC